MAKNGTVASVSDLQDGENSKPETPYNIQEFLESDFQEEEERDMVVFRVRETILKRLLDRLEERNEEERVQAWTVECFGKALKTLVDWYYLPRDQGDVSLDWDRDFELDPVRPDNWASFTTPFLNYPPEKRFAFHRGPRLERSWHEESDVGDERAGDGEREAKSVGGTDEDEAMKNEKNRQDRYDSIVGPSDESSLRKFWEDPSLSTAGVNYESKSSSKRSQSKKSKTSQTQRAIPTKREIGLFIHPKDFPTTRVTPQVSHVPGEAFSPKVCSKKMEVKTYMVKSVRPRKFSSLISEQQHKPRSYTF